MISNSLLPPPSTSDKFLLNSFMQHWQILYGKSYWSKERTPLKPSQGFIYKYSRWCTTLAYPGESKPPINRCPCDSRGCHSIMWTCPHMSKACLMLLRWEGGSVKSMTMWVDEYVSWHLWGMWVIKFWIWGRVRKWMDMPLQIPSVSDAFYLLPCSAIEHQQILNSNKAALPPILHICSSVFVWPHFDHICLTTLRERKMIEWRMMRKDAGTAPEVWPWKGTHSLCTFPLSHIKVHLYMASEK
jgi:hypothetical protein